MNLACKAVLGAITDMDFAAPEAADFVPPAAGARTFLDAINRDPVATVRTTVRVVSIVCFISRCTLMLNLVDPSILFTPAIFFRSPQGPADERPPASAGRRY